MLALGATVVVAALLVLAANFFMNQQISGQENRNEYLRGEIRKLERDIQRIEELEEVRENLIARKNVIEQLQSSRNPDGSPVQTRWRRLCRKASP